VYCPFCGFCAIMEDPTDRIFECLKCGVKSCRYCHVKSHHPISCEGRLPHSTFFIPLPIPVSQEVCLTSMRGLMADGSLSTTK
jgi:hypothetical protein